MKIYQHVNDFPRLKRPILTLGTFDGVHIGHQKILLRLKDLSSHLDGEVVLLTFYPHPRKVLFPEKNDLQLLSSMPEKTELLKKYGVQHLVIHPFTREFANTEHDAFVREVLVEKIGVHTVIIGYDHQFGHNRKGSFKELKELSVVYGFNVEEIPEQDIDEIAVSSTRIRKSLLEGNVEDAAQLLGYDYSLSGKVIKGKQLGRTLGFPTANLQLDDADKLVPANGVYAVLVSHAEKTFKGVLSIGKRPTFDNGERSIEVNIFDFDRDIYNENIRIILKNYLRSDLKFDSAEALIKQMNSDKNESMELLKNFNVK